MGRLSAVLAVTLMLLISGCSSKHPHTEFDAKLTTRPTAPPCAALGGVGASAMGTEDADLFLSVEMQEGANAG